MHSFYAMKNKIRLVAFVTLTLFLSPISSFAQSPVESLETKPLEPGQLDALSADGEKLGLFPLQHTKVDAEVSGFISRVTVTQFYENPFEKSIEAVYTFPLPDDAAVDRMEMIVGDRTIKGLIKKREEAQKIYEQARERGQTASLLSQERPNIFTQSVANIHPGDKIRVQISYVQVLKYEAGRYSFRFPMVVGPRYVPGVPLKQAQSGSGMYPDTDQVPDASRISPPVLSEGTRSGHDISVHLRVDAGVPVHKISSPSHKIVTTRDGKASLEVVLDPADRIPNKDFVLHYHVAGDSPELAVLATADKDRGGHFMFMVQPKADFNLNEITAKEMFFVVDNSGSMRGKPIGAAKALVRKAIREMNPDDTFQILRFSERASAMAPQPLPNTPENVKRGLQYIDGMRGMGGTNMNSGINAALDSRRDPNRLRIVLFLTDGFIGNDRNILSTVQRKIGNARIFSMGVGSSPNTYLLNKMAWYGRGSVDYLRHDQETAPFVERFFTRISSPYLTDIKIDWRGLDVQQMTPARIPDLFMGQPLVVYGRYKKGGRAKVRVQAKIAGKPVTFTVPVHLPRKSERHDTISTVWARKMIESLETELLYRYNRHDQTGTVKEITQLALKYGLMSNYTSFVAVEETLRRNADGKLERVVQPVELPDGVSREGIFGPPSRPIHRRFRRRQSGSYYPRRPKGTRMGFTAYGHGSGSGQLSSSSSAQVGETVTGLSSFKPKPPPTQSLASQGVSLKFASLQGGSRKDRAILKDWLTKALAKQSGCLSRRIESKDATIKVEFTIEEGGVLSLVRIRDRGGVQNMTVRCLLFALVGKVDGKLKEGRYKLALRLTK